ncbi:MAG: HEAT repeat domain-containing protein [Leptospiraceae bacterium]|nr:HEAT repeat domain-containing protein [Leptospiraceae bacterium]
MNTGRYTKSTLLALITVLIAFSVPDRTLQAGAEDDSRRMWTNIYDEAVWDLRFGTAREKVNAARMFGAHQKTEYIRPLSDELLRDLESETFRHLPANDPYVKATIAWALGEIGHKHVVPQLLKALEITDRLITAEIDAVKAARAEYEQSVAGGGNANPNAEEGDDFRIDPVFIEPTRPGPFIRGGFRFAYSPDMWWTLSDEFKSAAGILDDDGAQQIRLENANYMNLARAIFGALAKIGDDRAVEPLQAYLAPEKIPHLRVYAAHALGQIGSDSGVQAVKAAYDSEADELVKIQFCLAILKNNKADFDYYYKLTEFLASDDRRIRLDAARAFEVLSMGESEPTLREALRIESDPLIRGVLEKAIHNAVIDYITPVNY